MSGQSTVHGSRRGRRSARLVAAAALPLVLLTAGCQGAKSSPASDHATSTPSVVAVKAAPMTLAVDQQGTAPLAPTDVVSFSATHGRITAVSVTGAKGQVLPGQLSADHASWRSTGTLPLATTLSYSVTAVPADGSDAKTITGTLETLKPKKKLTTAISPLTQTTVGVGMPIVVRFNVAVDKADRAAVQKALQVETSRPVEAAWSWVSPTEVHYRPKEYWPAHTRVQLHVKLDGVKAAEGVYGMKNEEVDFTIADSMVSVVDVKAHEMTVRRNGEVVRTVPITTGKAGYLTRNGTKVILEKYKMEVMDSTTVGIPKGSKDYYYLKVPYAMRVTWSGEFVHAAPWSTANQGLANVSHGCVGMSMSNAIWLFNLSHIGDIVKVVNSPRPLEPGNGYTDWNVSWSDWLAGSAT